ncbi:MAG: hypothetical protein WAV38_28765 [Xanthobacteraceae bacterium]
MNYLDHVARLAALQAAAEASKIFEQHPNLTAAEREAVIGAKLIRARHDYLDSYERSDADAALKAAVGAVCNELDSGSIEQGEAAAGARSTDDEQNDDLSGLSPRAAAAMLHRRRAGR